MICAVSFSTLTLYVQQASGNPFLNFFGQSIAETPAHLLGTILVDRIGRRLTNSSTSFMAAVFCIPAMFLCTCKYWTPQIFYIQRNSNWLIHWIPFIECLDQGYEYLGNLSMVAVKFWTAITFFAVYLQGSEMYPTCLRQTGLSMGAIGSNLTGIFSPYIAYLVSEWDDSIWIVYKTEAFELFFPSKYLFSCSFRCHLTFLRAFRIVHIIQMLQQLKVGASQQMLDIGRKSLETIHWPETCI